MTVAELRAALAECPDYHEVFLQSTGFLEAITPYIGATVALIGTEPIDHFIEGP